ncbi:MAG TPA: FRG domain-containing protein [Longimicrobium sp.]|jgi:hypothetical protein|uniref:FRG domain-containing protein n=1 Tax=Longimicrobium sp. TaxID=2029185 RepID=UPI002EDB558F
MLEIPISSFTELHNAFSRYRKNNIWWFRGHSSSEWELKPKAGREPYSASNDERFFEAWKRRAIEHVNTPLSSDWDWLALAQHHGLATRLLDWSYNPLVATYFAVEPDQECDAVVYAYYNAHTTDPSKTKPFNTKGVVRFRPRGIAQRITRQGGLFTVHGPPSAALDEHLGKDHQLEKIIIRAEYRRELLFELSHYGLNRETLFPDLDGLSAHANWYMVNKAYWQGQNPEELLQTE